MCRLHTVHAPKYEENHRRDVLCTSIYRADQHATRNSGRPWYMATPWWILDVDDDQPPLGHTHAWSRPMFFCDCKKEGCTCNMWNKYAWRHKAKAYSGMCFGNNFSRRIFSWTYLTPFRSCGEKVAKIPETTRMASGRSDASKHPSRRQPNSLRSDMNWRRLCSTRRMI